jgi:diadenylate cyclase
MHEIWLILRTMSLADAFDIVLVAIPFYIMFALLREARSYYALWGLIWTLIGFLVIYLAARIGGLRATALIYERFWLIVVLLFLIIFQGELKKAITDVGRLRIFRVLFPQETHVVEEVIDAVQDMAQNRVGAILAFERGNTLAPYLGTGTMLDARASSEMIRTIFSPKSPLHDGALIIRGERLVAGSCILPLAARENLSRDLGTRHRAAIGLTEETDALVVVVSEETGQIALAEDGEIERNLAPEDLRRRLRQELDLQGDGHEGTAHG